MNKSDPQTTTIIEKPRLPLNTGKVKISVSVSADMNISAYAARQKVGGFVCDRVSYLMGAGEPILVASDHLYWRVPVIFTLPGHGKIGEVGTIDVNIENGQLMVTPDLINRLQNHAETLAHHTTS